MVGILLYAIVDLTQSYPEVSMSLRVIIKYICSKYTVSSTVNSMDVSNIPRVGILGLYLCRRLVRTDDPCRRSPVVYGHRNQYK